MVAYVFRRLIVSLPVLFIGLTLTFFIIHLAPGDPTLRFLDPSMGIELKEQVAENFGLNQPVHIQYFSWLIRVVGHLDFGNSFHNGQPAIEVVLRALKPTILVTGLALLLGIALGIAGGMVAALHRNYAPDRIVTSTMLFFYSMPSFWLGVMLLGLFAIKLHWLPASQLTSVYYDQLGFFARIGDVIKHLVLPVSTLGLVTASVFGRYVRSSLIEVLNSEYVLAARAHGLSPWTIRFRYELRNALIPVVSLLGMSIPVLFSGAVMVEVVFSLPGMGKVMVDAVLGRDYPVILAASSLAFVSVIIGNLLADIGYAWADPRVRLES